MSVLTRIKSVILSENQGLVKKIGSVFLLQVVGAILSYLFQVGLARSLSVDDFGLYSLIINYVFIGSFLTKFGMDKWSMKVVAIEEQQLNLRKTNTNLHLASLLVFSGVVLIVMLIHFSGLYKLDVLFNEGILTVIILMVFFKGVLEINKGFSRALFSTTTSIFPTMVLVPFVSLTGLLLVRNSLAGQPLQLSEALYVFLGALLSGFLTYFIVYLFKLKTKSPTEISKYKPLEMLKKSAGIFSNGFAQMLMKRLDIVIIGFIATKADVALFSAALKINIIIKLALESTRMVIAPMIARLYNKGDYSGLNSYLRRVNKVIMLYALLVFAMVALFGEYLLSFFGSEYVAVYPVLLLITVANLINVGFGPTGVFMNMTGMDKIFLKIISLALVLFAVLSSLLLLKFGLSGVAIATIITAMFLNGCQTVFIYRRDKIYSGFLTVFLVKILRLS